MAESESEALERARRELADALARVEHDLPSETEPSALVPPPPSLPPPPPVAPSASAAAFRRPSRPAGPGGPGGPGATPPRPAAPSSASPAGTQTGQPAPPAPAKPKPPRPQRTDRPDRPAAPPSTVWSQDEAAEVAAQYDPMSEIVDDDDAAAVFVSAPEPDAFVQRAPTPKSATGPGGIKRLAFRRTAIPILLTCGVLLIGMGSLRWLAGPDSIFADMSIPLSATLGGCGLFLLLVAVLNMLQVKGELGAAVKRGG